MIKNNKILMLLFAGVLMGALDIAIIGPALPAIQKTFNLTTREASWVFNIYLLANLISTPLMGKLSDMLGRRWIYVINLAIFAIGSGIILTSYDFSIMLIGRAVQGLGSGGIFPVASAVIGDTFPKEKQGAALGMIGAVFGLAFIIGPLVGALLLMISWHLLFAINIPIAIILIIYSIRLLPTKSIDSKFLFDWKGAIMLTVILFCFAYGFNKFDASNFINSLLSANVLPFIVITLVLIPLFYLNEKRHSSPIINTQLIKSKQLVVTYIVAFGAGLGESAVMFMPSMAAKVFDLTPSEASFMLIPMIVGMFIAAPLGGRLLDKLGSKIVIISGIIVLTIGLFSLSIFGAEKIGFYVAGTLVGIGLAALVGSPLRYIMNRETTQNERASGQGILTISTSSGKIMFTALSGGLIASLGGGLGGYQISFGILGLLVIITLMAAFMLKSRELEIAH